MTVWNSQYLLLSAFSSSQLCGHPFLHLSAVGHDCFKDGEGVGTNWLLLFIAGTCLIVSLQCQEWVIQIKSPIPFLDKYLLPASLEQNQKNVLKKEIKIYRKIFIRRFCDYFSKWYSQLFWVMAYVWCQALSEKWGECDPNPCLAWHAIQPTFKFSSVKNVF